MSSQVQVNASWVWRGAGLPQRNGFVRVEIPNGLTLPNAVSIGSYCIVPGLINSHTHLEFSDILTPIPASEHFADWLQAVVDYRRGASQNRGLQHIDAATRGWHESTSAGVQWAFDIAHPTTKAQPQISVERRTQFAELIATTQGRARQTWRAAISESKKYHQAGEFGLSPHAPYTTTGLLVQKAAERCQVERWPFMMHLAESKDEVEWLSSGRGLLQEFMEQVVGADLMSTKHRLSLVEYVAALSAGPCSFLVHGNYLDERSLDVLQRARDRIAVVYCPRTHAHFGHDPYPLQSFRERGIPILLGTDSRASNPDLSILEEARFLRKAFPQLRSEEIFQMITTRPMEHLKKIGFAMNIGWTAIPCESNNPNDVLESLLEDARSAQTVENLLVKLDQKST
jgi:aminodeoxyfutalosine deaminase